MRIQKRFTQILLSICLVVFTAPQSWSNQDTLPEPHWSEGARAESLPRTTSDFLVGWLDAIAASGKSVSGTAHPNAPGRVYSLLRWLAAQTKTGGQNPGDIPPYDRRFHFGHWINEDAPANCYDTRHEVLLRDAKPEFPVVFFKNNRCQVRAGAWHDPYTNRIFKTTASLQIDHVVPLKNAYISGAWRWTRAVRCHYANFLGNNYHLLPVHGRENMSKNSGDPSRYLPPSRRYLCDYVRIWMKVKVVWGLAATSDEADGIQRAMALGRCDPKDQIISEKELREMRARAAALPAVCARRPDLTRSANSANDPYSDIIDLDDPELRALYTNTR